VIGELAGVDEVVVPVRAGTTVGACVVPLRNVEISPPDSFDRDLSWSVVQLSEADQPVDLGACWTPAVSAARRALAAEIIGASRAMLDLATEHTSRRTQFGKPIASFQAVRHRLAEAYACVDSTAATWSTRAISSRTMEYET
jgi:hypothetical protein